MKGFVSKLTLLSMLLSSMFMSSVSPVAAGGVTVSLGTPSSSASGAPGISQKVSWVRSTSASYPTDATVTITITPAITGVASSTAFALDEGGVNNAIFASTSTDGLTTTVLLRVTSATAASTTFAVPLSNFIFPATAQNYSVSVYTSSPVDFGSALFYANGGNQVNVTASVPATLSFAIRNSADSANTNSCALGTLTTAATSTCSYRLRVQTNAASGFVATMQADHDFGSGSATMTNTGNDGSAANNAGSEAYGIQTIAGASSGGRNSGTGLYDQPVTEPDVTASYTLSVDPSPVPTASALTVESYSASFSVSSTPSLTGTTLVTHFANISGGTPAGNYLQTVTYNVTATF